MKVCCCDNYDKDCKHQIYLDILSPNILPPLQQHGGAYGIELFFKRYFGNLDFKVGYVLRYHLALRYAVFLPFG